jgi:UDP-GlcNAc:undecaprenyl-phosphate GlcNAc-1-phosphate transferase
LISNIIILIGSLLVSIFTIKISIRLAYKIDYLDYPNRTRKFQDNPIPKIGGLPVVLTFTILSTLIGVIANDFIPLSSIFSVILPAFLAGVIGFIDDIKDINPWIRLLLQSLVGILASLCGIEINLTNYEYINIFILVGFFLILINAFNLIDNSDGLANGTFLIITIFATIITYLNGQILVLYLGILLIGLIFGFLIYNWFPAKIYLGDSGVYFISTLLAIFLIEIHSNTIDQLSSVAILLLFVLYPILDMMYVVIKRIYLGIHPFTAGRDHLFHYVNSLGYSTPVAVIKLLIIHTLFCTVGFLSYLLLY